MVGMEQVPITIRLTPEQHEALRRAAYMTRQPMTAIIRRGITLELNRIGALEDPR